MYTPINGDLARLFETYLGQYLEIVIDRPMGSRHPQWGFLYPVNYGYLPDTLAADGEEIDAYVLGVFEPLDRFHGRCIAIIHRRDDEDPKLVLAPAEVTYSTTQIQALVEFQERFFDSVIIPVENL